MESCDLFCLVSFYSYTFVVRSTVCVSIENEPRRIALFVLSDRVTAILFEKVSDSCLLVCQINYKTEEAIAILF